MLDGLTISMIMLCMENRISREVERSCLPMNSCRLITHRIRWEGGSNDESFEDGDFLAKDEDDEESA